MAETLVITALGHSGDGIAETPDGRVFVPFALPGETVLAERHGDRATLTEIVASSPDRVTPPCPHFGACGGCSLQHFAPDAYLAWKRGQVVAAFAQRGIDAPVAPMIPAPPASRRRAVLTAERQGREVRLGFNREGSHEIVPIPDCRVLVPAIVRALPMLTALVAPLVPPGRRGRVTVLATGAGLDIAIDDIGKAEYRASTGAAAKAADSSVARVTVNGEEVFRTREPALRAGEALLLPPAGGFVQAVAEAEDAMAAVVMVGVGKAKTIADLFAGTGTFTFRLARKAKVTAVDGDGPSLAALELAARRTKGVKAVTTMRRDLFRAPLVPHELKVFDAVVFDPPRAGAMAQATALAASVVPRVVAVSCNPATLARDARILIDGGYRLTGVQPIDQFLWSGHIEAVATFAR
ncbi:MAG: class I SAM-dependent RNA methyltransferase [Bauldia sp.]|nr:class I SAM-dependent RNA methyltransferase [Bauldia sp.]